MMMVMMMLMVMMTTLMLLLICWGSLACCHNGIEVAGETLRGCRSSLLSYPLTEY